MTQRTYLRSQHRFFDSLVEFTASISSLGIALAAQKNGNALRFSPNEFIALTGNPAVAGIEFHFYPENIFSTLADGGWPSKLMLIEHPINQRPVAHSLCLSDLQGIHGAMITSAFIKYYEENRSFTVTKYSENSQNWPSVWKFARVVRNALVHKGTIKLDKPNAQPVVWRGLSYSNSDNGKAVLYHDVTAVELILLMEDMDAVI